MTPRLPCVSRRFWAGRLLLGMAMFVVMVLVCRKAAWSSTEEGGTIELRDFAERVIEAAPKNAVFHVAAFQGPGDRSAELRIALTQELRARGAAVDSLDYTIEIRGAIEQITRGELGLRIHLDLFDDRGRPFLRIADDRPLAFTSFDRPVRAPSRFDDEGKRYALIIGVNTYAAAGPDDLPSLKYAEADAEELADVLTAGGYEVTVMTQSYAGSQRHLGMFLPSQAYIDAQLDELFEKKLQDEDTVIIAFAGHGVQLVEKTDEGSEVLRYFFCPNDAQIRVDGEYLVDFKKLDAAHHLISIQSVLDRMANCGAGKKLLLADMCRTRPGTRSSNSSGPPMAPAEGGVVAFFGCRPNEKANESDELRHGVFFYHVIEGLRGAADLSGASLSGDAVITLPELQAYITNSVPNYVKENPGQFGGAEQVPEIDGTISGEFHLIGLSNLGVGSAAGDMRRFTDLPEFQMAWIPAGRFMMGSPSSEAGRYEDETQIETNFTRGYWISQTEITQAQWKQVMNTEPWLGKSSVEIGDRYPATWVSWDDAMQFCIRLTELERAAGRLVPSESYTLPTEAQWECGYRCGQGSMFHWGDAAGRLNDFAWSLSNTGAIGEAYAHEVGLKEPSAWGLHDMSGNVLEWCSDWYHPVIAGGSDPMGPESGVERSFRGGCWFYSDPRGFRAAYRFGMTPTHRSSYMGFRIVRVREQ